MADDSPQSLPSASKPQSESAAALCGLGGVIGAMLVGLLARGHEGELFSGVRMPSTGGLVFVALIVGGLAWCLGGILRKLVPMRSTTMSQLTMLGLGVILGGVLLVVGLWGLADVVRWSARR
jgi:hypothetical protein